MKKILCIALSVVILLTSLFGVSLTASANEYCTCYCDDCSQDYSCECYCGDCTYCEYDDDSDDDSDEECYCCDDCDGSYDCGCCDECYDDSYDSDDDFDDSDDDSDDNSDDDGSQIDEGTDPKEVESTYSFEDMTQDIMNIHPSQSCGDSMLWYVVGTTLYVFGSGNMYDYSESNSAPWSNLKISKVVIRKGVESIGSYAFYKSTAKTVDLSSTVNEIKSHAFESCENIIKLTLNMNLESVGDFAFSNCTGLKQVTLNNTLVNLGQYAFSQCTELNYVRFPKTLEVIPSSAFKNCTSLKRLVLREGLISVDSFAFYNCTQLASVQLPTTLTTIDTYAFFNCTNLNSIDFSNSVYEIKEKAFFYCSSLNNINFGKIISIGDYAFANSGVTSVSIPKTLANIGTSIFYNCSFVSIDVTQNANAYKIFKKYSNASVVCKVHDNCSATTVKATFSEDGRIDGKVCRACNYETSVKIVYQIKDVTLSKTSVTYNGNVQMPTVKAVDRTGKIISNSNYTVSFSSGFKNVGTYTVKVTFKNNYSGTKTLSYTINPASTTVSSLTAQSKGIKVAIKKQATQTTGYQIQYSTSSSFSSAKTVTISSNATTSKSLTGLTAKKKYYVRVRTYKTLNGKNYYSSWSSYKSVTTKS